MIDILIFIVAFFLGWSYGVYRMRKKYHALLDEFQRRPKTGILEEEDLKKMKNPNPPEPDL